MLLWVRNVVRAQLTNRAIDWPVRLGGGSLVVPAWVGCRFEVSRYLLPQREAWAWRISGLSMESASIVAVVLRESSGLLVWEGLSLDITWASLLPYLIGPSHQRGCFDSRGVDAAHTCPQKEGPRNWCHLQPIFNFLWLFFSIRNDDLEFNLGASHLWEDPPCLSF